MRDGKNTCMMYCTGDYWVVNAAGVQNTAFATGVPLVAGKMPGAKACDDNYIRRLFSSDQSVSITVDATMNAVDLVCKPPQPRSFMHAVFGAARGLISVVLSGSTVQLNVLYYPANLTTVTSSQSLKLCDVPLPDSIVSPMTTLDGNVLYVTVSDAGVVLSVDDDFTIAADTKIAFTVTYITSQAS